MPSTNLKINPKSKLAPKKVYLTTGRRKTATARVFLTPGNGKIIINKKTLDEYFGRPTSRMRVHQAFKLLGLENKFDITVTVKGSGITGQADAIRHGIARALIQYDEEGQSPEALLEVKESPEKTKTYRHILRKDHLVTRDSRKVERKKVGYRKARKKEQYSKR